MSASPPTCPQFRQEDAVIVSSSVMKRIGMVQPAHRGQGLTLPTYSTLAHADSLLVGEIPLLIFAVPCARDSSILQSTTLSDDEKAETQTPVSAEGDMNWAGPRFDFYSVSAGGDAGAPSRGVRGVSEDSPFRIREV